MTLDEYRAAVARGREDWGDGPWSTEDDLLACTMGPPDYRFRILRNPDMGNLLGYLRVPPGHPWHGKRCEDVEVHGGVTFAGVDPGTGIWDADPDGWWLGFDCAHYRDLVPFMHGRRMADVRRSVRGFEPGVAERLVDRQSVGETYRDVQFVLAELGRLADQAEAAQEATHEHAH